jgi:2-dehydropantoate 2-reductase
MRILVVGAGAIGGYFGGRLLQAGRDVTFLVRPKRAAQLAKTGLAIRSPHGDVNLPKPPVVQAEALRAPFDLILLSCKAYDLDSAMEAFAPAIGPTTAILPLLNGMHHIEALDARFGAEHTLGGLCLISSTLDAEGRILHLNDLHGLTFGPRDGKRAPRIEAIAETLAGAGFDARLSDEIVQDMWDKWLFIASAAGITCLMRATIGDIVAAGGAKFAIALIDECAAVAAGRGFAPADAIVQRIRALQTAPGSPLTASMLRDIERGAPAEADHIIGDLLRRGAEKAVSSPLLGIVDAHLRAYEARRIRTEAAAKGS